MKINREDSVLGYASGDDFEAGIETDDLGFMQQGSVPDVLSTIYRLQGKYQNYIFRFPQTIYTPYPNLEKFKQGDLICFRKGSKFMVYKEITGRTAINRGLVQDMKHKLTPIYNIVRTNTGSEGVFWSRSEGGNFLTNCRDRNVDLDREYSKLTGMYSKAVHEGGFNNEVRATELKHALQPYEDMYKIFAMASALVSKDIDVLSTVAVTTGLPNYRLGNYEFCMFYSENDNEQVCIDLGIDRIVYSMKGTDYFFE